MTENINRKPKGVPAGGQFAATTHSEPETSLIAANEDDLDRTLDAVKSADFEVDVDGRQFAVHGAGTDRPTVSSRTTFGNIRRFRTESGSPSRKTPAEWAAGVMAKARHAAACQAAWAADEDAFHESADARVTDFNVRFTHDGTRIIDVDLERDGRNYSLTRRGDEDVTVQLEGFEGDLPLPQVQLDAICLDFDDEHTEGTGDIRIKAMMTDAADRAAAEPGFRAEPRTRK